MIFVENKCLFDYEYINYIKYTSVHTILYW